MKKQITLLLIVFASVAVSAQNPCISLLDDSQKRIEEAYSTIKNFRDTINYYADKKLLPNQVVSYDKLYAHLYSSIKKGGANLKTESFLPDFFANLDVKLQEDAKRINNLTDDSARFIESYKLLKKLQNPYEVRLFEVEIVPFNCASMPEISKLSADYNDQLKSVGRRMGRLIQSAMLEDADYVTPNSLSRLDLAMTELMLIEYNLRDEFNSRITPPKAIKDTIYVLCKEPEIDLTRQYYISGVVDLENSLGIGLYAPGKFDVGIDLLFNPTSEGDVIIHPKIGAGRGMFHFALGGYYQIVENSLEFTANIYVLNKRLLGGVGFNTNRILFSLGYAF